MRFSHGLYFASHCAGFKLLKKVEEDSFMLVQKKKPVSGKKPAVAAPVVVVKEVCLLCRLISVPQ